jgi:hypothetical protein
MNPIAQLYFQETVTKFEFSPSFGNHCIHVTQANTPHILPQDGKVNN